jgi:uncharacterized protein (TIGR04145 family)
VNNGFSTDGYYTEWEDIVHTEISDDKDGSEVHAVALVIHNARLYVHIAAANDWKQLPTDSMYLFINGNITYDKKDKPIKGDSMLIGLAEVGDDMTMGTKLKKINSPEIVLDLGAFEYEGHHTRYLGEAAFTVYDAENEAGDECEFYINRAEIASFYGLNENEIFEIAMYFPGLGTQILKVTGVSTGPYLGTALSVIFVGGYLLIKRRKKEKAE